VGTATGIRSHGWAWALAAIVILGIPFLLFHDLLSFDRVLYERDVHLMLWSQAHAFDRVVGLGSWPLWDSFRGFGEPMLANPSAHVLYPWAWLALGARPDAYYTVFVVGHFVLAGAGAAWWGRRLGLSLPSALLMATVFTASGPFVSLTTLWHHLAGASFMPWVLGAAEALVLAPTRRRTLALGAVLSLQSLAGSADMCLLTALLCLVIPGRHLWRRSGRVPLRPVLEKAAIAALLAGSLSLPMWLPALELVAGSARAALPPSSRTAWSVHPYNLIQVIAPLLPAEMPLRAEVRGLLFGLREPFLNSLYLGGAMLPLAAAALVGRRRGLGAIALAVALLATLVSLGRFGVLYDLAIAIAPPLRSVRYPVKVMLATAVAWSLACGLGLEAWRGLEAGARRRWAVIVVAPTAVLGLILCGLTTFLAWGPDAALGAVFSFGDGSTRGAALAPVVARLGRAAGLVLVALVVCALPLRPRNGPRTARLAALAAGIAGLELVASQSGINPTAPRHLFASPPPVVEALRADGGRRVYSFDYVTRVLGKSYRRPEIRLPVPDPGSPLHVDLRGALAAQAFLCPVSGERWDFRGSFEPDFLGLKPRPLQNFNLVVRAAEETPSFRRFLEIGAVTHVVGLHVEGLEDFVPLARIPDSFAGTVHAFRVPDPLPRAYAVGSARQAEGLKAFRLMADPAFDPRREIILPTAEPAPEVGGEGRVRFLADLPDRVELEADMSGEGYVVLVDAYDRGWKATVDDRSVPLLRANMAFRAVRVAQGSHRITFRYDPAGLQLGLVLALSGLAVVAVVLALGRREPTAPRGPDATS
jgi:hypothetical protein